VEKETIENKDIELIKKFRTIIHNKEKKTTPQHFPFGLIFLFTALIISGMLLLKQQSTTLSSKVPKASSRVQLAPVPAKQPASNVGTMEIKTSDTPKVLASSQKMVDKETVLKSSGSVLSNPILEQNSPAKFSNQRVQGDMPLGIRIEEIISCSSVNDKKYSKPKSKFSLAQDDTPKIWMKVISENTPFTLTHVYYCNGRKYCEVPLAIRYHRMRTWSTVTLRSPEHIGKWRVEVIDENGAKLDQIEFTVVK
jgi:hypothetical protein